MKNLVINPQLWTQDEVVIGDKTIRHGESTEVSDTEAKTLLDMTGSLFGREMPLVVEASQAKKMDLQQPQPADNTGGGIVPEVTGGSGQPKQ